MKNKTDFKLLESDVLDKQGQIVMSDNQSLVDNLNENQLAIVRSYDQSNNPLDEMGLYIKFKGETYKVNLSKVEDG